MSNTPAVNDCSQSSPGRPESGALADGMRQALEIIMQTPTTAADLQQAFDLCKVVLEAIMSAGADGLPSGPLYAVMATDRNGNPGITLEIYEAMIALLIRSNVITRKNHRLYAV